MYIKRLKRLFRAMSNVRTQYRSSPMQSKYHIFEQLLQISVRKSLQMRTSPLESRGMIATIQISIACLPVRYLTTLSSCKMLGHVAFRFYAISLPIYLKFSSSKACVLQSGLLFCSSPFFLHVIFGWFRNFDISDDDEFISLSKYLHTSFDLIICNLPLCS